MLRFIAFFSTIRNTFFLRHFSTHPGGISLPSLKRQNFVERFRMVPLATSSRNFFSCEGHVPGTFVCFPFLSRRLILRLRCSVLIVGLDSMPRQFAFSVCCYSSGVVPLVERSGVLRLPVGKPEKRTADLEHVAAKHTSFTSTVPPHFFLPNTKRSRCFSTSSASRSNQ